ncbi:hypothetical protein ACLOJK_023368 [Asimina triloba]
MAAVAQPIFQDLRRKKNLVVRMPCNYDFTVKSNSQLGLENIQDVVKRIIVAGDGARERALPRILAQRLSLNVRKKERNGKKEMTMEGGQDERDGQRARSGRKRTLERRRWREKEVGGSTWVEEEDRTRDTTIEGSTCVKGEDRTRDVMVEGSTWEHKDGR